MTVAGITVICVLCEPEDACALWLAAALRGRREDVEVVHTDDLMDGSALTCQIDSSSTTSELRLGDGRTITDTSPDLIVNRLTTVPPAEAATSATDAAFLAEEWRATLAVWLRTMRCVVLNPPRAASLSGSAMPTAAWCAAASAHGLVCRPWDSAFEGSAVDPVQVTCVAGRCLDPTRRLPDALRARLAALARFTGTPLLGATFDTSGGAWAFVDATSTPALSAGGRPLVDCIVECAHAGWALT